MGRPFVQGLVVLLLSTTSLRSKDLPISFVSSANNDLYRVMTAGGHHYQRYDSVLEAYAKAPEGSGVLVLADSYPNKTTPVDDTLEFANQRKLRVYLEFPASLPGVEVGQPQGLRNGRAVVTSETFGAALSKMRILEINDCRFVPIPSSSSLKPWLVYARIAGFDRAIYGPPATEAYPILFEQRNGTVLVSTTKLSQFVTARYAPLDAWRAVWQTIFKWLAPGYDVETIQWTPVVRPSYRKDDPLPPDAELQAFHRGVAWFSNAHLFINRAWQQGDEWEPFLPRTAPVRFSGPQGNGTAGMAEGLNGSVHFDGSQPLNYFLRDDCTGEVTFPLALSSLIERNEQNARIAANLADWIHFRSILESGPRSDPKSPSFGLVGGGARRRSVDIYYADDGARSMLGNIGMAAVLKSSRWDERILRVALANFRTTGSLGFRAWRLEDPEIQEHGWQYFYNRPTVLYQPHYEAYPWAFYLWVYGKTHYRPLLDRTEKAISMTMAAYPAGWHWTNGIQQERARMLLPLAWLIRVDDTSEHREWLKRMTLELLRAQDTSGAIREEIGELDKGDMKPPLSNEQYGTNEAPLIQENGDPVSDLLYTVNFALLGLHEAASATDDPFYHEAEDKLVNFLVRIQARSERKEFDGAWLRAFEYHRWEYWASNSDAGWSAWSVESGWTQSWITSVLGMRHLKTSYWDLTGSSKIASYWNSLLPVMLPPGR